MTRFPNAATPVPVRQHATNAWSSEKEFCKGEQKEIGEKKGQKTDRQRDSERMKPNSSDMFFM